MPLDFEFPDDFFDPPAERPDDWPEHPDVRRAVEWLRGFIPENEWRQRRLNAARRLYEAATGALIDPSGVGRFFDDRDQFAWVLFLGEAYIDHLWNYEPMYGARVIPIFQAIGRKVDQLKQVAGVEERVRRLVGSERSQPNGALFEMLVAAAYLDDGYEVEFVPETPDARTHDLNVTREGYSLAVECKRMETGEYSDNERQWARDLWRPCSHRLALTLTNTICNVTFRQALDEVPAAYLEEKVREWQTSNRDNYIWNDDIGFGSIGTVDLEPLQSVLETDTVLFSSSRFQELVTGRYAARQNIIQVARFQIWNGNPRYIADCDTVIILNWKCVAEEAVRLKARDVLRKIADANDQLPGDRPGVIHVGLEALEDNTVERLRAAKIEETTGRFSPGPKPLHWIFTHYFVPETPPDMSWQFDETTQWRKVGSHFSPLPLRTGFLITAEGDQTSSDGHWQKPFD